MAYILLSAKRRAYFCKSIAIEIGGVSRYFFKVSGSGDDLTSEKQGNQKKNKGWSGARLRGRTATQHSKRVLRRFWEGFWGRGSQKGSEKGACYGFYSKKGF